MTNSSPIAGDVTVVIPPYTDERWELSKAAIASVLSQTLRPREVIVCVDHNPRLSRDFKRRGATATSPPPRSRFDRREPIRRARLRLAHDGTGGSRHPRSSCSSTTTLSLGPDGSLPCEHPSTIRRSSLSVATPCPTTQPIVRSGSPTSLTGSSVAHIGASRPALHRSLVSSERLSPHAGTTC